MTLKLRPHHVEKLIELDSKNILYRAFFYGLVKTLYGAEAHKDWQETVLRIKAGEEVALTRGVGELCKHCPYQQACLNEEYGVQENMPWLGRMLGTTLLNTRNLDDIAINNLELEEGENYRLDHLFR